MERVAGLTDRPWSVYGPAVATMLAGLSIALAGLRSWPATPMATRLIVPSTLATHRLAAFVVGAQFVVLGRGLVNRRWLAHRALTLVVFVGAFINTVGSEPHRVVAFIGLAIGVLLVATRDRYRVEPDLARVQHALTAAAGVVTAIAVVITGWLLWRHPATAGRPTLGHAAHAAAAAMVGADGTLGDLAGGRAGHLSALLMAVTALVVLAASVVVLAPHAPPEPDADPAERRLVEAMVDSPSADGLSPFVLRRDKAYVFSADGRAAIGYRVLSGVALFGGDPVGDPGSFDAAIDAFLRVCAERGWRPAGIGARGDLAPRWERRGLTSIGVGEEVVVEPAGFRLDTPRLRNVRQAVKRSANFGVTTTIQREGDLPVAVRDEFLDLAHRVWGSEGERGFSMNLDHVLDGERPELMVALARDAGGAPVGFQRYVASGGGRMLSLDTMVRVPEAPNGVNERMIVEMIGWAGAQGTERVSLNFAAFRELFEKEDRPPFERLGYWGIHRFDRYIKVESLYRFNNKFRPMWVPRSMVLRRWTDVGWVLLAALQAEFGLRVPFGTEARAERSRELHPLPRVDR